MQLVGGRKQESFTCCCINSECLEWGIKMTNLIYGIAVNNGKYPAVVNHKNTREYSLWKSMLQRCYCVKYQKKQQTYIGCSVSDNFKNYSYFYEWVLKQKNYNKDEWQLDKDVILKGNKLYSEDLCVFLPREINAFFNSKQNINREYKLGVSFRENVGLFVARCNTNSKSKFLGYFNTEEEAYFAYKTYKESLCKKIANKWKNEIDSRAYDAMMVWSVG